MANSKIVEVAPDAEADDAQLPPHEEEGGEQEDAEANQRPKTVPLSSLKEPFEMVFIGPTWTERLREKGPDAYDWLLRSEVTNAQTVYFLTVPNVGTTLVEALHFAENVLGLTFRCVWKNLTFKSKASVAKTRTTGGEVAAFIHGLDAKPLIEATTQGGTPLYARPTTAQVLMFYTLESDANALDALLVKPNTGQDMVVSDMAPVLDAAADYWPFSRLLACNCGNASNAAQEYAVAVLEEGADEPELSRKRSFTVKSARKKRMLRAFLVSHKYNALKALKSSWEALTSKVSKSGAGPVEKPSEEELEPIVEAWEEHFDFFPHPDTEWDEFCAFIKEHQVRSRFARRLRHLAAKEGKGTAKRSKGTKRKAAEGDEEGETDDEASPVPHHNGFARPRPIADNLKSFLEKNFTPQEIGFTEEGHIARTRAVKLVIEYVKRRGLQDPTKKILFFPNEELRSLFSVSENCISFFGFSKYFNQFYPSEPKAGVAKPEKAPRAAKRGRPSAKAKASAAGEAEGGSAVAVEGA